MAEIEIRLHRYFVAIAEERHFARAAERLGISPSTLTHQIQLLEKWLSVKLCYRNSTTRVQLTDAGERFLVQARLVLRQADEAQAVLRRAARGEVGRINVGYMMSVSCADLIKKFIGAFAHDHPGVEIDLKHRVTLAQLNALVANDQDVGFTRPTSQYPTGLDGFIVHEEPLVIVMPKKHRLARYKRVPPDKLRDENFITTTAGVELGFPRYTQAVTDLGNFDVKVVKRATDVFTLLTYVSAGFGITVTSRCMNRVALPNIVFRELDVPKPPTSPIAFVYRRNEPSPAVRALIKGMRRHRLR